MATYFTFLPCFFFIFMGAPYIEKLRGNLKLFSALSSITAAVVGVVLNLAVWFGVQVLIPLEQLSTGLGQSWESHPLQPFNGGNWASLPSSWVQPVSGLCRFLVVTAAFR